MAFVAVTVEPQGKIRPNGPMTTVWQVIDIRTEVVSFQTSLNQLYLPMHVARFGRPVLMQSVGRQARACIEAIRPADRRPNMSRILTERDRAGAIIGADFMGAIAPTANNLWVPQVAPRGLGQNVQ